MVESDPFLSAASAARRRAAEAMRRTTEAFVRADADDDCFDLLTADLLAATARLSRAPDRIARIDHLKTTAYEQPPPEGAPTHHNPDCIACGPANPAGHGLVVHRRGDGVVGRLTIGDAGRGAPGRAHGGVVAMAFDDLMGHVLVVLGVPAYTVRLEVEYLEPAPVGGPVEMVAHPYEREGRRLAIRAEARAAGTQGAGTVLARATGIFVTVRELGNLGRPDAPV